MIFQYYPGCGSKAKTKKIMYDLTENEDFDREEIPTYEVSWIFIVRPVFTSSVSGIRQNPAIFQPSGIRPDTGYSLLVLLLHP